MKAWTPGLEPCWVTPCHHYYQQRTHYTDKVVEAQRDEVVFLGLYGKRLAVLGFALSSQALYVPALLPRAGAVAIEEVFPHLQS